MFFPEFSMYTSYNLEFMVFRVGFVFFRGFTVLFSVFRAIFVYFRGFTCFVLFLGILVLQVFLRCYTKKTTKGFSIFFGICVRFPIM